MTLRDAEALRCLSFLQCISNPKPSVNVMTAELESSGQPIHSLDRSWGATPAERRLQALCRKSFLSMWSYPNVFRNQDISKGEGKEICDVLIVFGNDVLIFSDKDCAFPSSGNVIVDWKKWYRRSIAASAKQLFAAERWLRMFPDRVFTDRKCRRQLPIDLPPTDKMRIHRILVAHGSGHACKKHFGNGTGSLILDSSVIGCESRVSEELPFSVGYVDDTKRFVHVLDDVTFELLLSYLDTITDFVDYLAAKERLFADRKFIMATGEEDLLAIYLTHIDEHQKHTFKFPAEYAGIGIFEGEWIEFQNSVAFRSRMHANRVSYIWDALIEKLAGQFIAQDFFHTNAPSLRDNEIAIRTMAAEPRFVRRALAEKLHAFIQESTGRLRTASLCGEIGPNRTTYVYLTLAHLPQDSYESYREVRRTLLSHYCAVAKVKFPNSASVIGLATEPGTHGPKSETLICQDSKHWTAENQRAAEAIQEELKLFKDVNVRPFVMREYPNQSRRPPTAFDARRNKRNLSCHCGSGLKFKRCCGSR